MPISKMDIAQIQAELADLNANLGQLWQIKDEKLHKAFNFANFVAAFGFMTQVAICAERMDHHPEWFNVYSRVIVDLTTHEAGGITARDFALARQMETITA
jgi:4a-hydroxytetrahydrobiopterin dehydratase